MSSSSKARPCGDWPEHPLLRIVANKSPWPQAFRAFNRELRGSLQCSLAPSKRILHARNVLQQSAELQLGDEDLLAFRLEWLRIVAPDLQDPLLYEELARVELTTAHVELNPRQWYEAEPLGIDLPHFVRTGSGSFFYEHVRAAGSAWSELTKLALRALQTGELSHWGKAECLATCRALILRGMACSPGRPHDVNAQLVLMEGLGAALWSQVSARLGEFCPNAKEPIWSPEVHRKLLLHLQGLLQTSASQPPLSACPSADEHGNEPSVEPAPCAMPRLHVVVTEAIPPAFEKSDKEALKQYEALRNPLPLAPMPKRHELDACFRELRGEFPWATEAVSCLEDMLWPGCLLGFQSIKMRPVLLVGNPGSGKSRLARRVAEMFKLPYMAIACGGSADSKMLSGTARGWSTGEPMPLLGLLHRRKTASAFVLLDEIDKAGLHHSSPPLPSLLLALLEPETASRWRDGYLQASCDLTGVSFWATANSLKPLTRPLLSRFELVHVPEPGPEHLQSLADSIVEELERGWNLEPGTLPKLPIFSCSGIKTKANARELRRWVQAELARYVRQTFKPERLH